MQGGVPLGKKFYLSSTFYFFTRFPCSHIYDALFRVSHAAGISLRGRELEIENHSTFAYFPISWRAAKKKNKNQFPNSISSPISHQKSWKTFTNGLQLRNFVPLSLFVTDQTSYFCYPSLDNKNRSGVARFPLPAAKFQSCVCCSRSRNLEIIR